MFLSCDDQLAGTAAHGVVEGERDGVMKIRSPLGRVTPRVVPSMEHVGKEITERRRRWSSDAD
jgi:hypothetical protein